MLLLQQKFNKGDYVQVAKDLGPYMPHFQNDCKAIVIGSYADQYGGSNDGSYTIYIKGSGETSWYDEPQLTLIERNRIGLLEEWKVEANKKYKTQSNLDWIFENGPDMLVNAKGASIQALANCFGLTNLWGNRGEGITWYTNASHTMQLAAPFLLKKDKEGWLKYCEQIKETKE